MLKKIIINLYFLFLTTSFAFAGWDDFAKGSDIDLLGKDITNVNQIYGNSTYIDIETGTDTDGGTWLDFIYDDNLDLGESLRVGGRLYVSGYSKFRYEAILLGGASMQSNWLFHDTAGWARTRWNARGNDTLRLSLGCNNVLYSGYYVIGHVSWWDVDGENPVAVNPTLRIESATNPAVNSTQHGDLYHNQKDFVIETGTGSVKIIGAFKFDYEVLTDSGTVTISSGTVVNCTKNGAMSVTLPTASGNIGLYFKIKKSGTVGAVTLITDGAETIDGIDDPTYVDAQYDFLGIVSDGTNWIVVDRYIQ